MVQKHGIGFVVIVAIIAFIWYNSLQNEFSSDGISIAVTKWLQPVFHQLGLSGDLWSLNRIVRKLAHIIEYTILGVSLFAVWHQFDEDFGGLKATAIGFFIALLDECIQLFSFGRNASIRDVAIDTMGVVIGIVVAQIILSITKYMRHSRLK